MCWAGLGRDLDQNTVRLGEHSREKLGPEDRTSLRKLLDRAFLEGRKGVSKSWGEAGVREVWGTETNSVELIWVVYEGDSWKILVANEA